jgi:hypothetical protein
VDWMEVVSEVILVGRTNESRNVVGDILNSGDQPALHLQCGLANQECVIRVLIDAKNMSMPLNGKSLDNLAETDKSMKQLTMAVKQLISLSTTASIYKFITNYQSIKTTSYKPLKVDETHKKRQFTHQQH